MRLFTGTTPTYIPDDVLCLVFENSTGYGPRDCMDFAMCVSRVCRRWRRAALTTRDIWASIHFSTSTDIYDLQIIPLFLARSGDRFLRLELLDDAHRSSARAAAAVVHLGPLVQSNRNRIASILIRTVSAGVGLSAIFRLFQYFASTSLRDLHVGVEPWLTSDNPTISIETWSVAPASVFTGNLPSLKRLSLDRVYWPDCPLRNLEHITLRHTPVDDMENWDLEDMLALSPRLRAIQLIRCIPASVPRDHGPIVLDSLDTLNVAAQSRQLTESITSFLTLLDARALRTVILQNSEDTSWTSLWTMLMENTAIIWPSVVDLRIDTWALHPIFASAFPSLQILVVGIYPGRDVPLPEAHDAAWPEDCWSRLSSLAVRATFSTRHLTSLKSFLDARNTETHAKIILQVRANQPELCELSGLVNEGVIEIHSSLEPRTL